MEHLLDRGGERDAGCPYGWQIQRGCWRILFAGSFRGPAYLLPLYLVEDHSRLCPMVELLKTDLATAQKEVFDVLGVLEMDKDGIIMRGSVVRQPVELKAELRKHSAKLAELA